MKKNNLIPESSDKMTKAFCKMSLRGRYYRGNLISEARLLRYTRNDDFYRRIWITPLLLFIIFSTSLILDSCAPLPKEVKEADLKESLRSTAVTYWKMRMGDKYENTYKLEDREGLPPFETYRMKVMAMKRIPILSHSVKEVRVTGDTALVDVEFSFILPATAKPFKQIVTEKWVYKEGQWWHQLPPD